MSDIIKSILDIGDIQAIKPNFDAIKILKRDVCEKVQTIIFDKEGNTIKLITTNNLPEEVQKIIKTFEQKGLKTDVNYTSVDGFNEAMKWYDTYDEMEQKKEEEIRKEQTASGQGAIGMLKEVFEKRNTMEPGDFIMEVVRLSFQTGASDLHFQSQEDGILCRLRIDGVMQEVLKFTHEDFAKYLQKLKFISGVKMNIDYIPQDGRFSFESTNRDGQEKKVDARVNFMPGITTESTVIRFLDPSKGISTFEKIGFEGRCYDTLKRALEKNTGIIIFTGPTGSGKTTTLYTILNYLNDGKEKIITLEDPVEYQLPGIQQSQINYAKGYDYAEGLKAILRHDPDIILVGETRDFETANISINAALTGHKVFTTLHTNSAIESINRLINMGLEPFMIAPSLNLIAAQRLVRGVCPHCVTKREGSYAEKAEIDDAIKKIKDANPNIEISFDGNIPVAVGCEKCNGTGYQGRVAIIETFEITDDIRDLISKKASDIDLYAKARENGYLTLKEDGILKLLAGKTTLDELRRVL